MRDLQAQLRDWQGAKIVTAKQATAIKRFESERALAAPAPAGRTGGVAEAIGYVGAAIAVAAVGLLLANRWQDLTLGGKLGIVGALTAIVGSAGIALRGSGRAPVRRLVSVLLAAAVGGACWIVEILLTAETGWRARDIALTVAFAALALSIPLYLWRHRALPQLIMLASVMVVVETVLARPAFTGDFPWWGLSAWAIGVAWVLLGLGKWLEPGPVATVAGSLVALIAAASASGGEDRTLMLTIGLVTAGALLARAVALEATYLVAIGAIGVLVFVPQLVVRLFGKGVGALVTMLVVGLLLVLVAVRLVRGRRGEGGAGDAKDARR